MSREYLQVQIMQSMEKSIAQWIEDVDEYIPYVDHEQIVRFVGKVVTDELHALFLEEHFFGRPVVDICNDLRRRVNEILLEASPEDVEDYFLFMREQWSDVVE